MAVSPAMANEGLSNTQILILASVVHCKQHCCAFFQSVFSNQLISQLCVCVVLQVGDKLFSFVHFESPTPSGKRAHSSHNTCYCVSDTI